MGRLLKAIKTSYAAFVAETSTNVEDRSASPKTDAQLIGRIAGVAVGGAAFILYCIPTDLGALKPTATALLKLAKLLWTGKGLSAIPL